MTLEAETAYDVAVVGGGAAGLSAALVEAILDAFIHPNPRLKNDQVECCVIDLTFHEFPSCILVLCWGHSPDEEPIAPRIRDDDDLIETSRREFNLKLLSRGGWIANIRRTSQGTHHRELSCDHDRVLT